MSYVFCNSIKVWLKVSYKLKINDWSYFFFPPDLFQVYFILKSIDENVFSEGPGRKAFGDR